MPQQAQTSSGPELRNGSLNQNQVSKYNILVPQRALEPK